MKRLVNKRYAQLAGIVIVLIAALSGYGCLSFQFITVDEQTALEAQILGSFEELDKKLLLVSSVRGSQNQQQVQLTPVEQSALRAQLSRQYNRDDLETFKDNHCIAELKSGFIKKLKCEYASSDPTKKKLLNEIVTEENNDRRAIFEAVLAQNLELSETDLPRVGAVFYEFMLENAKPNHLFQTKNGAIVPKSEIKKK